MALIASDDVIDAALAAIDPDALARDAAALVQAPSPTGDERPAFERLAELAASHGLDVDLHAHDLAALRAHPEHPGEEAPRAELLGLTASLDGGRPQRVCVNGHLDVVGPGTVPWRHGPWSGTITDGWLHGRGAVDMKGGVVAALHALAALRTAGRADAIPTTVLQAVGSEEDGGLGTFAALERDAAFDACLIPEPTELDVVSAQAGALTFRGTITGRSTHAALHLAGRSAIDRYLPVHAALADYERTLNADVASEVMRALALPYPICVGRVVAGGWSSSVPDSLEFEGRVGVRVGESVPEARRGFEAAVHEALAGEEPTVEITWSGGSFASAETPPDHPWVRRVVGAVAAERGAPPALVGVPWGADMRLFAARGIPCTMFGPSGIELAHATDERVRIDELVLLARAIVRVLLASG